MKTLPSLCRESIIWSEQEGNVEHSKCLVAGLQQPKSGFFLGIEGTYHCFSTHLPILDSASVLVTVNVF
jgi:hypothetical protein